MRNLFLFCVLSLFIPICILAQNKTMAVIGSSTAKGYGLANVETESWVNRVRNYYVASGVFANNSAVVNLAQSSTNPVTGMPTGYVSPYTAAGYQIPDPNINITKAVSLIPKPDVIIVSYPTNGYDWMPFNDILFLLSSIKNYAEAAGVICYITTTQPRNNFSVAEKQKLKLLRDSIMQRFGEFAIDFWTPIAGTDNNILPQFNMDNVHPNAAGHEALFQAVIAKNIFTTVVPPPPTPSFVSISAVKINARSEIHWSAQNETQDVVYEIQKSKDSIQFEKIGSLACNGSSPVNAYKFMDSRPFRGYNFYRVMLIRSPEAKSYSSIVSVYHLKRKFTAQFFVPRLTGNRLYLTIEASMPMKIDISVMDINGIQKPLGMQPLQQGINTLDLPVNYLSSGIYFVKLSGGHETQVLKFIR